MKGQDIVVLLKLVSLEEQVNLGSFDEGKGVAGRQDPYSVRSLEVSLGISKTEISASLNRSSDTSLATKTPKRFIPNRRNLCEFVIHGLRYTFPVKPRAPQRGIPTGFAAPMLDGQLLGIGDEIYVWPSADGIRRGLAVDPLFSSVPQAVRKDKRLYEFLALIDAIRLGRQRESNLAKEKFKQGLLGE